MKTLGTSHRWVHGAVAAGLLASLCACSQALTLNLAPGECMLLPEESEIASVNTVDCSAEHNAEVVDTIALTDAQLPPEAELETRANEKCTEKFESYVGITLEQSAMELKWLLPTPASWKSGDRTITCLAVAPDQQNLSLPLKNSRL